MFVGSDAIGGDVVGDDVIVGDAVVDDTVVGNAVAGDAIANTVVGDAVISISSPWEHVSLAMFPQFLRVWITYSGSLCFIVFIFGF